jgi:hypothetical protein
MPSGLQKQVNVSPTATTVWVPGAALGTVKVIFSEVVTAWAGRAAPLKATAVPTDSARSGAVAVATCTPSKRIRTFSPKKTLPTVASTVSPGRPSLRLSEQVATMSRPGAAVVVVDP